MSDIQSGSPLELSDPYRQLVDGVQDYAIFLLDRAGHIVTWNRGAERSRATAPRRSSAGTSRCFYPPEAIERGWPERELEDRAQASGRFEDEGWRVRKDGTRSGPTS